jgi:SAM-dependent methyltransferase
MAQAMDLESRTTGPYDSRFYEGQVETSLLSARIYVKHLWQFIQPASVLDVGCGRGAWLKACHELGSQVLLGFDGDWNSQSQMIDDSIKFNSIDLNMPFFAPHKVDLGISLEVAEHLEPATAPQFVKCLADASDAVLFSAAYIGQGGTNHINEQRHSYWAHLFAGQGLVPFDLFRPFFWGNDDVCFWYRQNTFLYCRSGSIAWDRMRSHGFRQIAEPSFMDCVHPDLFDLRNAQIEGGSGLKNHLTDLGPSLWRAITRRL